MKRILNIFAILSVFSLCLAACQEDEASKTYGPIKVTGAFLNNTTSTTRPVTEARVGTMIRLEGEGFLGIQSIVCNGEEAYINPNYILSNSIIFRIPGDAPTGSECDETIVNTIVISSKGNEDYTYSFTILGPAPSITSVSHTLPQAGEVVTVTGSNLRDIFKVGLYNDDNELVVETEEIVENDPDGLSFSFKAPDFGDQGGYLIVEGSGGKAASPNYMNRKSLIFLSKFSDESTEDGHMKNNINCPTCSSGSDGYAAWGSNTSANLTEVIPAEGDGPKSPAVYRSIPEVAGPVSTIALDNGEHSADGGKCIGRYCFKSCACTGRVLGLADGLITTATPTDKLALQFDYFIPCTWNSGRIAFTFVDNGINWMANYHPWTKDEKQKEPMTEWRTANIPLTSFPNFVDQTYGFLLKNTVAGVNGDYANQGMIAFYNDDCDGNAAVELSDFIFYFANFRIVPYETPELEEESEEE